MKKISLSLLIVICILLFVFDFSAQNNDGRKVIPAEVEVAVNEALEKFPTLEEINIRFEFKDEIGNHFMQALPDFRTIFKDPTKRTYLIKMTRVMKVDSAMVPISEMPHDVLVGWFAHELGHVMDYLDRDWLNMAGFGLRYVISEKYKAKAERRADMFAIHHGCGDSIVCTKNFILNNSALPDSYLDKIREFYLSPERVLEIVKELDEEMEEEEEKLTGFYSPILPEENEASIPILNPITQEDNSAQVRVPYFNF